ncbi:MULTISPECIES: C39 family peptidase [unclassified Thioalkalivibrio]|uniref:C39 family peptidase n=1 Tax=unclassified Thioalkalivibrio TaxID=2621013 RepID=UPI0003790A3B|nr:MULTISPECIES: cysteine peptidase family C39 domain-containing protein [unclassified Thioalkalivibrio]
MPIRRWFLCAVITTTLMFSPTLSAWASGAQFPGMIGSMNVPVESLKDLRFRSIVPQRYDFSCGSAALATLLTYHYDRPTTEVETFDSMFRHGDQDLIREQGFSMLDMKHYLEGQKGLPADGFRIGLDDLENLGVPAIAMIETRGYRHFVVIKGIEGGRILVGDPALGVKSYTRHEFQRVWVNDILFIIREDVDLARHHFNASETWAAVTRAPIESGVVRSDLASFTLHLPRASDW